MLHLHRNSKFNKTMEHNLIAVSTILVEQYKEDFEFAIMFENITNKLFVYQTILCDYTELKENEDVSDFIERLLIYLTDDKELNEKLSSYNNWETFEHDFLQTEIFTQLIENAFENAFSKSMN